MSFPESPILPDEQRIFRIKARIAAEREESRLDQLWSKRLLQFFAVLISACLGSWLLGLYLFG
jgi:hypothetical protein